VRGEERGGKKFMKNALDMNRAFKEEMMERLLACFSVVSVYFYGAVG
jgi:hypothetical protein